MANAKRLNVTEYPTLEADQNKGTFVPYTLRLALHPPKDRRERWRNSAAQTYPVKNGYGDPLSALIVVTALAELKPEQAIRAGSLADLLNRDHPHIQWDATTVGRILSQLHDLAQEHRRAAKEAVPAIERRQSPAGVYYSVYDAHAAWEWLHHLMDHLSDMADAAIQMVRRGMGGPSRIDSLWSEIPPLRQVA